MKEHDHTKPLVALIRSGLEPEAFLSQKQVIQRIREECGIAVSPRTINAWVASGMPFAKIQRRKIYLWSVILDWLMNPRQGDPRIESVRDSQFRRRMRRAG